MYTYRPNVFAVEKFGLTAMSYTCSGLTHLLENALGRENCGKFVIAQDPFCGGVTQDDVSILVNPDKPREHWQYRSIGMVFKEKPL